MANRIHDIGVASRVGAYSDAIEVEPDARWFFTSGTPGIGADGDVPDGITQQAELAWGHIVAMLKRVDMTLADIVKATHYLVRASDVADYVKVRSRVLGEVRPASMLLIVPALVRPEFLVEIEVIAARPR